MLSPCSRYQQASSQLLLLREEFDRVYPLACASNDVGLAKKFIEAYKRKLNAYRIEFLGKYYSVEIGRMTKEELIMALENVGIGISTNARYIIKSDYFRIAEKPKQIELICLTAADLFGDEELHTTEEIYQRAKELGFLLCPAEIGPYLRLAYRDQPLGEWCYIAMEPIVIPNFRPNGFGLTHDAVGVLLYENWYGPDSECDPKTRFVFRLSATSLPPEVDVV